MSQQENKQQLDVSTGTAAKVGLFGFLGVTAGAVLIPVIIVGVLLFCCVIFMAIGSTGTA